MSAKLLNETPHQINVEGYSNPIPSNVTAETLPRATEMARLPIGSVLLRGEVESTEIPIELIVYGKSKNLPPPRDGVLRVVSQLTVLAALREGRDVEDLLYPYEFNSRTRTVRGLAVPHPVLVPQRLLNLKAHCKFDALESVSEAPVTVFAPDTPPFVGGDVAPRVRIEPLAAPQLKVCHESADQDERLTCELGVPIFRPRNPSVEYGPDYFPEETITIVDPKAYVAGLEMYDGDTVRAAFVDMSVRSAMGEYKGSVVGGKSLLVPLHSDYVI